MTASISNPYKGLFRYTAADEDSFFGREQETQDIIEMVQTKQLVTLYGESGTGKTSLIHAKLFPELNRKYFFTVYIRINFTDKKTPLEQVRERINEELDKLLKDVVGARFEEKTTLLESASNICLFGGLVKPVLFFDQFEEIFTLGPKYQNHNALTAFVEQLSDLVEVRSAKVGASADNLTTPDELTRNALNFRTVISLRQDYVGYLDDLKFDLPSLLYGKYHLKKFTIAQAREAICGPLHGQYAGTRISLGNVRLIIRQMGVSDVSLDEWLSDENAPIVKPYISCSVIDPTLLSLFCYEIYNKVQIELQDNALSAKSNAEEGYNLVFKKITSSANVEDTIGQYYEKHLAQLPTLRQAIEEQLINESGKRLLVPLAKFGNEGGVDTSAVERFIEASALLKGYGENDKKEIEIVHDQVAKYALSSRKKRDAAQVAASYATKIRKRAIIWTGVFSLIALVITSVYVIYQKGQYSVISLRENVSQLETQLDSAQIRLSREKNTVEDLNQRNAILSKEFSATVSAANEKYSLLQRANASTQRMLHDTITTLKENKVKLATSFNLWKSSAFRQDRIVRECEISLARSNSENNFLTGEVDTLRKQLKLNNEKLQTLRRENEALKRSAEQVRYPTAKQEEQNTSPSKTSTTGKARQKQQKQ